MKAKNIGLEEKLNAASHTIDKLKGGLGPRDEKNAGVRSQLSDVDLDLLHRLIAGDQGEQAS